MGIYIHGMEMPKRCAECWLMDGEDSWCTACRGRHLYPEYRYGIKDRPDWCPIVPDSPHGRLGDLDELLKEANRIYDQYDAGIISEITCMNALAWAIRNATTIIQAEKGE